MHTTIFHRTNLSSFCLLLFLAVTQLQAEAQQPAPVVLTLERCRELAVTRNSDVRIASAQARQAEEESRAAFTNYFPEVSVQGMAYATNRGILQYEILDLWRIGILKNGWSASVTAMQPLFMGGRIVNGNRLARVGVEAGRIMERSATDQVLLTVENRYWELSTLKSERLTLLSVIAMADTLLRQVQVAVDAGVAVSNDLLRVRLQLNRFRADLVDLDNGIALSARLLAQTVGMDGTLIDIPAEPDSLLLSSAVPVDSGPDSSLALHIDPSMALPATSDYRLLELQTRAADLRTRLAVADCLPTLAAGGGYFLDRTFGQRHGFVGALVTLRIPISGWWGGSHTVRRARLDADVARMRKTSLSQMLCIKMQDTWDALTAARRKMLLAREAIGEASENLRLTRNCYEAGVSPLTDLLEAQTLYRSALDSFTAARGAWHTSVAAYLDATGRLSSEPSVSSASSGPNF